jgi:hypothetical protein
MLPNGTTSAPGHQDVHGTSACDVALALLEQGLWPIALHPPGVGIPSRSGPKITTGKEPIGRDWGRRRPTAADLIATYRAQPRAGVRIRLGLAGGVIDVEVDGPEGVASLEALIGPVPATLGWSSRRGPHHLFQYDARFLALKKSVLKLPAFPGLEIRLGANGAQLQSACPPTIGTDGNPRRWNGHGRIARLPEPAIERLLALASEPAPPPARDRAGLPHAAGSAYGAAALSGECVLVAGAGEGHRHDTLRSAALRVAALSKAGALEWDDGRRRLAEAAAASGLPESEARGILDWAWVHAQPRVIHMGFRSGAILPPPKAGSICITQKPSGVDPICITPGLLEEGSTCIVPEPPGASLERAGRRVAHVTVPAELVGNPRLEPVARVMIALDEEAARRGAATFHAPYRLIGDLAGVSGATTVMRRMGALGRLGYLSLIEAGIPGTGPTGKANTWVWHDPPRPGETVWNGASDPGAVERAARADVARALGDWRRQGIS